MGFPCVKNALVINENNDVAIIKRNVVSEKGERHVTYMRKVNFLIPFSRGKSSFAGAVQ
jgi:hypothetical protein